VQKSIFTLLMIIIVALAVLGQGQDEKTADMEKEKKPIEVFVTKVRVSEIFDAIEFGGFIQAEKSFPVAPEIAGTIHKVSVKLGDWVRRGQRLFSLKPARDGFQYQLHHVTSPIAGKVVEMSQKLGDRVLAGAAVMTVADTKKLITTFHVTYDDLFHIAKNTPLSVVIGRGSRWERSVVGSIESISPRADPDTGTYPIKTRLVCIKNCDQHFPVGSLVRVVIKKNLRQGVRVPVAYLQPGRRQVLKLDDKGAARWTDVELGNYYGELVEVKKGLAAEDTLVTSFSERPEEGQSLKVVTEQGPAVSLKTDDAKSTKAN